jgi:hypothetical protein
MIYKMLVNAAFLAIGYYIGKEVARSEQTGKKTGRAQESGARVTGTASNSDSANKSSS